MSSLRVKCCAIGSNDGPHKSMLEAHGFELSPGIANSEYYVEANLIEAIQGASAVIAGSEPYTRKVLTSAPGLRVIARTGVGFDAIDMATCDELGIVVVTTPGVNHHSVAEHTIAMLMGVGRGFPDQDQRVRENRWERIPYPRIMGTTLGLVGLGRIGQAVATRAVGLGMQVVACEPYPDMDFVDDWGIELVELDDLLSQSDYVSLHNPLLPETRGFMNAARFAQMKPGSVFINTARGALVVEADLIAALESGHLRAAALDVFEQEPLPLSSPLINMSNVLLAGHVAGLDNESQRDTLIMTAETLIALHKGDWPDQCIQNLKGQSNWKW